MIHNKMTSVAYNSLHNNPYQKLHTNVSSNNYSTHYINNSSSKSSLPHKPLPLNTTSHTTNYADMQRALATLKLSQHNSDNHKNTNGTNGIVRPGLNTNGPIRPTIPTTISNNTTRIVSNNIVTGNSNGINTNSSSITASGRRSRGTSPSPSHTQSITNASNNNNKSTSVPLNNKTSTNSVNGISSASSINGNTAVTPSSLNRNPVSATNPKVNSPPINSSSASSPSTQVTYTHISNTPTINPNNSNAQSTRQNNSHTVIGNGGNHLHSNGVSNHSNTTTHSNSTSSNVHSNVNGLNHNYNSLEPTNTRSLLPLNLSANQSHNPYSSYSSYGISSLSPANTRSIQTNSTLQPHPPSAINNNSVNGSAATRALHNSSYRPNNISATSNHTLNHINNHQSSPHSPNSDTTNTDNDDNNSNKSGSDNDNDSDIESEIDRRRTAHSRPTSSYKIINTNTPSNNINSNNQNINNSSSPKKSNIRTRALVGLQNIGNTCFLNSTLQCLFSTEPLMLYFATNKYQSEINPNQAKTKGKLAQSFALLAQRIINARDGSVETPSQLRQYIGLIAASFNNFGQHDSQELLRVLLSGLHDDLNRIKKQPKYEEIKDLDSDTEEIKSNRWWKNYLDRNDSIIVDLFAGQLKSTVKCNSCNNISIAFDPFMDLSLPIPQSNKHNTNNINLNNYNLNDFSSSYSGYYKSMFSSNNQHDNSTNSSITLMDCFNEFTKLDELRGNDQAYCRKCKQHRDSSKELAIYRYPNILVVHLKRFANNSNNFGGMSRYSLLSNSFGRSKLSTDVQFPLQLDLNEFQRKINSKSPSNINNGNLTYNLFGISHHSGSTHGGHYTASCNVNGSWYNFNDSSVSSVSPNNITGPSAYVLFYQRANKHSLTASL